MKKITKRDVAFFFVGIFTMIIIDSVMNWDSSVKAFNAGLNANLSKTEIKQTTRP